MRSSLTSKGSRTFSLLPSLPLYFSTTVYYNHVLQRHGKCKLCLLGPAIHISNRLKLSVTISLSASTPIKLKGQRSAKIGTHSLHFETTKNRDEFLQAAIVAQNNVSKGVEAYTVIQQLGRGASGMVHLVRRKEDGKYFAMKCTVKSDALGSDARFTNLLEERRALLEARSRECEFVVKLVDVFESADYFCFVVELAELGDLAGVLKRLPKGRIEEEVARGLFAEMLLGLEELHGMGYVYRDLKLDNVLVNQHGHVRLADFDLARRVVFEEAGKGGEVEGTGSTTARAVEVMDNVVGTRIYMAPEVLKGKGTLHGKAADVWALGISLYMMLVGRHPYGRRGALGRDCTDILHTVGRREIAYPRCVSQQVAGLLRGLLERDASKRLDIVAIKSHEWLREMDWSRIRFESLNDIPQRGVRGTLDRYRIRSLLEDVKKRDEERGHRGRSAASRESVEGMPRQKKHIWGGRKHEIVGFDHVGVAKE